MNQCYASISIGAIPSKQKPRYVNETSRVDSLYIQNCFEGIMIIFTVDLKHFLKHNTNHSWTPCITGVGVIIGLSHTGVQLIILK